MPDEHLPDGPLLVVSPEMGDAALSCAALLGRDEPLTVLDVFTSVPEPDQVTEWERSAGFDSARAAMEAREQEEAAAFADTNHDVLAVDLLAQRYRRDQRDDGDERRLRRALDGWVRRAGACTVVLPAGAGHPPGAAAPAHARAIGAVLGRPPRTTDPDHLWVRDAATRILRSYPEVALALYEELPQVLSSPADRAVHLYAGWLGRRADAVEVPVDRRRKARRLRRYATLVPTVLGTGRSVARRLPATERYWLLRPGEPRTAGRP